MTGQNHCALGRGSLNATQYLEPILGDQDDRSYDRVGLQLRQQAQGFVAPVGNADNLEEGKLA